MPRRHMINRLRVSRCARPSDRVPGSCSAETVKVHGYQAKAILARHGVPVPAGEVVLTAPDAAALARRLGGTVVVKAQIHAGGRGKGGGVKVVKTPEDAEQAASLM